MVGCTVYVCANSNRMFLSPVANKSTLTTTVPSALLPPTLHTWVPVPRPVPSNTPPASPSATTSTRARVRRASWLVLCRGRVRLRNGRFLPPCRMPLCPLGMSMTVLGSRLWLRRLSRMRLLLGSTFDQLDLRGRSVGMGCYIRSTFGLILWSAVNEYNIIACIE